MQVQHRTLRGGIIARHGVGIKFLGNLREHPANFGLRFGFCSRKQAALDHVGCPHQKFAKQMRRDVQSLSDLLGQHAVFFRTIDQRREGIVGQPRARVVGNAARHFLIAAPNQHVGDGFTNSLPARQGVQVSLSFGLGNVDEIGLRQSYRLREHGPRDRYIVIVRKLTHQLGRCIRNR